jgi:hypothetical protein
MAQNCAESSVYDDSDDNDDIFRTSQEPSCPSHKNLEYSSNPNSDIVIIPDSIYRLGHSDKWACKNCNIRDDKWYMIKHHCKGAME